MSPTLCLMNFGGGESRGPLRHISRSRTRLKIMHSIVSGAAPFPASWLKSHARSLVRYHLHPETKFQGGEYDQRGPLKRRHVFALAQQSIGKEADNIEENEFIGEDADPPHYGVELTDRAAIAAAVFDIQQRYGISDRRLIDEAKVSHHTLAGLKEGKRIAVRL